MRFIAYIVVFLSTLLNAIAQNDSLNMTKIASWTDTTTGVYYNDVWGYSFEGREYAIVGTNHSTHFIDVTDSAKEIASFFGKNHDVVWRDYKVYGHYAYAVADNDGNSLQIFDLSDLPNSVTKVYGSNEFSESAHNIYIDNKRLYLASNKRFGTTFALEILSLDDPENPIYIGFLPVTKFGGSSVHDIYVKNDTAFCSAEYGGLYIYDLKDINNPILISSITSYPDQGYNHSSWVSEDGNTLVMADEVPNSMALKLFDISDINNPEYITKFQSNVGARPHNPFFIQDKIVVSYYFDGLQLFDVSNVNNPTQSAFYDTYPDNDTLSNPYPDEFEGCWGTYPFLRSGKILATDIKYGLFVLETPEIYSTVGIKEKQKNLFSVYPNPTHNSFSVQSDELINTIEIKNIYGQIIKEYNNINSFKTSLTTNGLEAGNYIIGLKSINGTSIKKITITK